MPLTYQQESFLGGINRQVDPTRIGKNQYMLGINVRNRKDVLETIQAPLDLVNQIPEGKLQGVYGLGSVQVLFVSGKAYYKNFLSNPEGTYTQIPGFQMDVNVDVIFAAAVPASTMNQYKIGIPILVQPNVADVSGPYIFSTAAIGQITAPSNVTSTRIGLVCQDGKTQPYILTADFGASLLQTYAQWGYTTTVDNREYVPIGKQMLWSGSILYIISPDGREIYRSVTGRPLDFVIAVGKNSYGTGGDKAGEANTTSYKLDYDPITCIRGLPANESASFFVSTLRTGYAVNPSFERTVFDEPTFTNETLFSTGAVNQFCVVDINGDTAIIDPHGIRSLNVTAALKQESNNEPFSKNLAPMLAGVEQTSPCSFEFDDYALFAVNTIYGPGVFVYDKLTQSFTSLDIFEGVGQIKMFSSVFYNNKRRLFFITTDNKMFEYYGDEDTVAPAKVYIGEWSSNNPKVEQRPEILRLVFTDCEVAGTVTATIFCDRLRGAAKTKQIDQTITMPVGAIPIPFVAATEDNVQIKSFTHLVDGHSGWKIGYLVEWDAKVKLSHVQVGTTELTGMFANTSQAAKEYVGAGGK